MSVQIKQVSTSMRILSSTEQERLCSYLNSEKNPYNIGILVCLFTGLRVGEICALHWEDISFSDRPCMFTKLYKESRINPLRKRKPELY